MPLSKQFLTLSSLAVIASTFTLTVGAFTCPSTKVVSSVTPKGQSALYAISNDENKHISENNNRRRAVIENMLVGGLMMGLTDVKPAQALVSLYVVCELTHSYFTGILIT